MCDVIGVHFTIHFQVYIDLLWKTLGETITRLSVAACECSRGKSTGLYYVCEHAEFHPFAWSPAVLSFFRPGSAFSGC